MITNLLQASGKKISQYKNVIISYTHNLIMSNAHKSLLTTLSTFNVIQNWKQKPKVIEVERTMR